MVYGNHHTADSRELDCHCCAFRSLGISSKFSAGLGFNQLMAIQSITIIIVASWLVAGQAKGLFSIHDHYCILEGGVLSFFERTMMVCYEMNSVVTVFLSLWVLRGLWNKRRFTEDDLNTFSARNAYFLAITFQVLHIFIQCLSSHNFLSDRDNFVDADDVSPSSSAVLK